MGKHCVYMQRNTSPAAYDTALIEDMQGRGWTVQVETDVLDSVDWSGVDLLIVGAPGTAYTFPPSQAIVGTVTVPVIILCRYTARLTVVMSTNSALATLGSWTRVAEDDRAILDTVTFPSASVHTIYDLKPNTSLIYQTSTAGRAGVAEQITGEYRRLFWGFHRFDAISDEMRDLWGSFIDALTEDEEDLGWVDQATVASADIFYRCYLEADDLPRLQVPISSWQGTLQADRSSYLQAVAPSASSLFPDIVQYRDLGGDFVIERVARFRDSGEEKTRELARAPLQLVRFDRGPTNATCTLSGYSKLYTNLQPGMPRTMQDIRSTSVSSGFRVRCAIDWLLRPADTAIVGDESITVSYINYYVNGRDAYMDIGDRSL